MSGSSNPELRASIHTKLIQSGEKEKLKEHLRQRLVECGWRDQLKLRAKAEVLNVTSFVCTYLISNLVFLTFVILVISPDTPAGLGQLQVRGAGSGHHADSPIFGARLR